MTSTAEEVLLRGSENLSEEIIYYVNFRFGVARNVLEQLHFTENEKGEIWVTSAATPPCIRAFRPTGIRAFRRTPHGLKPTTTFLCHLGDLVVKSRVEINNVTTLEAFLLGKRISYPLDDGYAAICYKGDILGCAQVKAEMAKAVISTKKRRELLDIIAKPI